MSLPFTEEQESLKDTIRHLVAEHCTSEYLRNRISTPNISDPELWAKFKELELFLSFATEDYGGVALGFREIGILSFESGYNLLPEPLTSAAFFGPYLLTQILEPESLKKIPDDVLKKIVKGEKRVTFAPLIGIKKFLIEKENLSATISFVESVATDSVVLIPDGSDLLFLDLEAQSDKIESQAETLLDGTVKSSSLIIKDATSTRLILKTGYSILPLLGTLKANEIAGACTKVFEMTTEYVKTRKQFDQPIGSFQAVQHKLADAYLYLNAMTALSNFAAWAVDHSPDQITLAGLSAIQFAAEKGPLIMESCLQLHGGVGFTWEYDLHLYLRRVRSIAPLWPAASNNLLDLFC